MRVHSSIRNKILIQIAAMCSAVESQLSPLIQIPRRRQNLLLRHRYQPTAAAASRRREISLRFHLPKCSSSQLLSSPTSYDDEDGIPIEDVKTLVKFKSRYNYIRVLQVSRRANHPLAGSRLLLLDAPGNIHSISFLFKSLTNAYYDVFATLPPLLPPGPLAIFGFGAGTAAKVILEMHPEAVIHGWELDPSVISVAREYFGLEKLEKKYPDQLFVHTGNALNASIKDGFCGVLVDLFRKGCVIPELQDPLTWERLKKQVRGGGRIMVNVGGRCVEAEDARKDGRVVMENTLAAMRKVYGDEVLVLMMDMNKRDESCIALTGKMPDYNLWKSALKKPLKSYADMWESFQYDPPLLHHMIR